MAILAAIGLVTLSGFLYLANYVYLTVLRPRWNTRYIPGPAPEGFFGGHMRSVINTIPIPWHEQFGSVIKFNGPVGTVQISTDDKKALQHILVTESYRFPKPELLRRMLALSLDQGIVVAEGNDHRRQRKIMNPAFGVTQMKTMYPIFAEKAGKLKEAIERHVLSAASGDKTLLNMFSIVGQATLDVISAAGFGYETNALENDENEMARAFHQLFGMQVKPRVSGLLAFMFPILRPLVRRNSGYSNVWEHAIGTMRRVCVELVEKKKSAVRSGAVNDSDQFEGKDLLSTLIRANMSDDLKENQKLSDREVLAQISTMLLAGNDTTANTLCWALYAMTRDTAIQDKLREELKAISDSPSYDEVTTLPYLDAIIRETLRVYSVVPGVTRIAIEDSIVPLAKPFVDKTGKKHSSLFIPKNTAIYVPILHMNLDTEVWGPDAKEYHPERWLEGKSSLPEGVLEMPSVAFPTFFAGPRSCIGFRFSILELKTILFVLVRNFKFELAIPAEEIERKMTNIIARPAIKDKPEDGYQMPLHVTVL